MQTDMETRYTWAAGLSQEQLAKQKAFFEVRVMHPKLEAVIEELLPLLTPYSESNLAFIVGATGAGKSAFCRVALRKLYAQQYERMQEHAAIIPIIAVEAYANGDSRRTFRELYQQMLRELKEPGINQKTYLEVDGSKARMRPSRTRARIGDLRESLESALEQRQTEVCVIDEAYHLLRFDKDSDVLETLKSLSNTTGSKIVLVGSYDLFDLVESKGQCARRSNVIHFDRYRSDDAEDRKAWRKIVKGLIAKWPCEQVPALDAIADELLEICLGCVGLLKSMLLEISAMQLRRKGRWDPKFLVKAAKANKLREVIRKEIEAGEEKVRDALYGQSMIDDSALARLITKMSAAHA